jgi:hypothetical protein
LPAAQWNARPQMKAFALTDVLEPAGDKPIRVLARVSVLRTEDGGRKGPFTASYRPIHNFGGPSDRIYYVGQVEVPAGTWVHPARLGIWWFTFCAARLVRPPCSCVRAHTTGCASCAIARLLAGHFMVAGLRRPPGFELASLARLIHAAA